MIEQFVVGAIGGSAVSAVLALWMHKVYNVRAMARLQRVSEVRIESLSNDNARQSGLIAQYMQEKEELESSNAVLRTELEKQKETIDMLRAESDAVMEQKNQSAQLASRIAGEAARLKTLAATFERWHEQMISLMAQNQDMHAKNHELSSIVRHVLIVSLNASIEAARAGVAGRGFAIVAGEVRALATRSEELSKDYSKSLHRNDLTTTATFQDIQAGGKMIMASLSSLDALAGQFQSTLH